MTDNRQEKVRKPFENRAKAETRVTEIARKRSRCRGEQR